MIRTQIIMPRMFRILRIFVSLILIFERNKITAFSWPTSNRMIDSGFVLILWRWSCFHQSRNHLFDGALRRWACFSLTITLKTISLIDRISCFSNDRIKSSRAFISWFCNILFRFLFFSSESRLMEEFKDFRFTLNNLAATTWLSVRFSLKNFFAWSITVTVDGGRWTVDGGRWTVDGGRWWWWWWRWRKRGLFWPEKGVDNQLENQINAITTATNDVSGGNIYQMGYMNQFQSNKWWFFLVVVVVNLIDDWFWWFDGLQCLPRLHRFPRLKSVRFLVGSH